MDMKIRISKDPAKNLRARNFWLVDGDSIMEHKHDKHTKRQQVHAEHDIPSYTILEHILNTFLFIYLVVLFIYFFSI